MDQRLKERLIGAAVLVALGVWLIPLVLHGPAKKPEDESTGLKLPTPDDGTAPVKSLTIQLDEQKHPPGTDAADTAEPTVAQSDERAPETAPPRAVPAKAPPAAPAAASPPPSEAPAPRPPPSPSPAPKQASAAEGWMVQVGSFSEEENARRLAQRVSTYGYKPVVATFKANGRTMWRVRLGPLPTRDQAEAEASALSVHGFVAQVVSAD
jgi:DedD protein